MWDFVKPEFTPEEFECSCCGTAEMDDRFMRSLVIARRKAGIPFRITSGYRCEAHDEDIGSTSGNHRGKAVDIACDDSYHRVIIVASLLEAGFRRIGVDRDFIHVDNTDKPEGMWLY